MILRFIATSKPARAARYMANIAAASLIFLDPGQHKVLLDIFAQGL
jgi:hypothetical protein